MAGVVLPSSLDEACDSSLDAFMAAVDEDKCEELEATLVKVLMEQQVRSVRRLLNTKVHVSFLRFCGLVVCCP